MRLATCNVLAVCLVALSALAVAGCGGSGSTNAAGAANASTGPDGRVVDVYSSLPWQGPSAAEAIPLKNGIELALEQAGYRAGQFEIHYTALDDSAGPSGWDPSETAANARQAAADPRTVFYIGEFDDEASEVSMPILNEAGIPQVGPANTYVGLTTTGSGSPGVTPYSPTGTRTYLRIVPTDAVQAAADLFAMKQTGCTRVAVLDDGEAYGAGLAKLVEVQKSSYGVDVVSQSAVAPTTVAHLRVFVDATRVERPGCFLVAGVPSSATVRMTKDAHLALPTAKIFAPAAMCTSAWTNPRDGGVPADIDPLIECTDVTLSLSSYPGGKSFRSAYEAKYRVANPSPYAILGYEAMSLGLSTISSLGPNGDSKSAMLSALFSTANRHSVLGTYGFDRNGDTTLRTFGLYKVGPSGNPEFMRTITPPHVS
jgi:branched-chain amino acid transport system substrate-binding protein